MKRSLVLLLLFALLALGVGTVLATSASRQEVTTHRFSDLAVVGDAWIERTDNGVTARAEVSGADPGVYTMWWIIWNTPEGCGTAYACDEPDLFDPDVGLAIGYVGGAVVGPDGNLHITGYLSEGETVTKFAYPEFQAIGLQLTESSMLDSHHAEVHLVLRNHGSKVPGLVGEAISSFNGACTYDFPLDPANPIYGTPGPNSCVDEYFAVFPSEDAS